MIFLEWYLILPKFKVGAQVSDKLNKNYFVLLQTALRISFANKILNFVRSNRTFGASKVINRNTQNLNYEPKIKSWSPL